jgi:hypothetical protein
MTNEPAYTPVQRCGFLFNRHQWGKWEIEQEALLTYQWQGQRKVEGKMIIQRRQCQKCGYYEYDKQEIRL